ncbi:Holliday junction resolvase [Lysinibacillus sp. BF-4]|uniref:Holliday junction resolvase RecU n=1 Tax=Lysinibacillus sp. BF-4 TaxID=1473546 RepID=UPI0005043D53|nr:Holliday junction resolvase RecU [Lysinibacillus sp. BF-4]KFL43785.1 Holliday junction resolvase [Lysinibacillus sp. BF-4]
MIRYPNGKRYSAKPSVQAPKKVSYGNRGQSLEDDLNETNLYYAAHDIAVIHKKPVPVQIVKVDYPMRSAAVIREAYFRTPSTTDYNGIWQGKYIDFEAKETKNKTSFPLNNIHEHQMQHMAAVQRHGGIVFFIIRFSTLERTYVVPLQLVVPYWQALKNDGRKSIPLKEFEQHAHLLATDYMPRIDYVSCLPSLESEETTK